MQLTINIKQVYIASMVMTINMGESRFDWSSFVPIDIEFIKNSYISSHDFKINCL